MENIDQNRIDTFVGGVKALSERKLYDEKLIQEIYYSFSLFFELITEFNNISFTSLFSRMVFSTAHYNFPPGLNFQNHSFRKICEKQKEEFQDYESICNFGIYLLWRNLNVIKEVIIPEKYQKNDFLANEPGDYKSRDYQRVSRIILTSINSLDGQALRLNYCSEEESHLEQSVVLRELNFCKQLLKIEQHIGLPVALSLLDIRNESDERRISAFVLNPDFLVGVTTISECFQSEGALAISALSRKLLPTDSNIHLLMGNVVNYFLDELIHDETLHFEQVLPEIFKISPISFAIMNDNELKEFIQKISIHFEHLKNLISTELQETKISKEKVSLEPSFYSNEYGIQGRLDLYHFDESKRQSDIIELKSGKLFKANGYGLNENHYVQTLMYDLLIESVHESVIKSNNYILYSALETKSLRYAPRIRAKQLHALHVRNDIILMEQVLSSGDEQLIHKLMCFLQPDKIPSGFNFLSRDAKYFSYFYERLSGIERSYYILFLGFINREYVLSKTGKHGINSDNGLAALWLNNLNEKIENYRILSYLRIKENKAGDHDPIIVMQFSNKSSKLSRFRIGDIAVLYPEDGKYNSAMHHQIYKCTIIEIDDELLVLRLRARQKNDELFKSFEFWHIEEDSLDSSFLKQYHGLYDFISSRIAYRRKILAIDPPDSGEYREYYRNDRLTKAQFGVVNKAICAKDYFLLWGPPGTGKTSIMINALVDYYFNNTNFNILLLAYTNKAVDEICESIEEPIGQSYIRIGSRYSTKEKYQDKLFSILISEVKSRRRLQELISENRVFVSTVSSYQGMKELTKIKNFDIVIIDEASQILEPMIVGMLGQFDKFILIGDHKQLPAVVRQSSEESFVSDISLSESTGLTNLSNSLFERLFNRCNENRWHWAYASLFEQGRMHQSILNYISPTFYESSLRVIPGIERLNKELELQSFDELSSILIAERMIFVNVPIGESVTRKTNALEADLVARIVMKWQQIYRDNRQVLNSNSLGVITPFRSQIALISEMLDSELRKIVSVDTVERYQGGSRDHIVISLAVSKAHLLDSISNVSSEGIDRKLNVALTRAKENVIIFGNKAVLEKSDSYRSLIEHCYKLDLKFVV